MGYFSIANLLFTSSSSVAGTVGRGVGSYGSGAYWYRNGVK